MKSEVLGFLGLGAMGFPMCYNLSKKYSMVLPAFRNGCKSNFCQLVPDYESKLALFNDMLKAGAHGAATLEELVGMSDIILMCVTDSKQVEDLILSPNGILQNAREGTILIDLTSSDPNSTKKLSRLLAEKGIEMLDAPISGGPLSAINQTLSIMVGGKEEIFEKSRPILETIGEKGKTVYVGPSGAGHTLKAANNFLAGCSLLSTTEAMMVVMKAGISPQIAIEVLKESSGSNNVIIDKYPNFIFPNKPWYSSIAHLVKDVGLFNQTAVEFNVPTFISPIVYQLFNVPVAKGEGDEDVINFINMYEEWCGVKVRGITE